MIWVIIFFYILPVLLWVDLLQATYKIAKEEEEDDVLCHYWNSLSTLSYC